VFNKCSTLFDEFILTNPSVPDNITQYMLAYSDYKEKYQPIFQHLVDKFNGEGDGIKEGYLVLAFLKSLQNSSILAIYKELVIYNLIA
jgi:hypothetical protein